MEFQLKGHSFFLERKKAIDIQKKVKKKHLTILWK